MSEHRQMPGNQAEQRGMSLMSTGATAKQPLSGGRAELSGAKEATGFRAIALQPRPPAATLTIETGAACRAAQVVFTHGFFSSVTAA